ncbi:MAG: hypothetical protein HY651_10465 [Acidobacteria bacterium]|nr:hypothetical protein [Acidobacteriota bacterium]
MRQTIIGLLVFVFGPIAALLLERQMSAAPEWVWKTLSFASILAGVILVLLADPIYSRFRGEHATRSTSTLILALAVATIASAAWWFLWPLWNPGIGTRETKSSVSNLVPAPSPTPPPSTHAKPDPIIRLNFDPFGNNLPLSIAPRAKINVVYIDEDGKPIMTENANTDHTKPLLWPSNAAPVTPVPTLRVSNVGDANAFNVTIRLKFMIGGDNIPGGQRRGEVDLLSIDLRSGGRDERVFYIVNRSPSLGAMIWFPSSTTALVQGEQRERSVPTTLTGFLKITYTDSTTGETFVVSSIPPSAYKWPR